MKKKIAVLCLVTLILTGISVLSVNHLRAEVEPPAPETGHCLRHASLGGNLMNWICTGDGCRPQNAGSFPSGPIWGCITPPVKPTVD